MNNLTDDKLESNYKGSALLHLLRYMKPYLGWVTVCLVLVLALTAFDLYRPMLIGDAIDLFESQGNYDVIIETAIKYGVVLVLSFLFNITQTWLLQKMGQSIILTVRKDLYAHIQSLSSRYFDLTPVGRLVTRVTNDVEALDEMYSGILVRLFRNIVMIIGLAAVMLALDFRLALISFLLLPIVAVLTVVFRKIARETYRISRTRLTDINTFLSENISGMRIIQIFGREKRKFEEFNDKNYKLYRAFYREMMVFAIFRPLIFILSILALMTVLGVGSKDVLNGTISIGTLYIFAQYIQSFFEPIQELAEQFSTLQSSIASAEKIFTIMSEEPLVKEDENPVVLPEIRGRIEFSHVWFAYDNENYVLRDVSFVIEPGERVAFVGATGAGKSSILNLIGRYYDIQKGNIYIDGVDIRNMKTESLHSQIGVVLQETFLFSGSILANIRFARQDASLTEVIQAAKAANAHDFICKTPDGYNTYVGEHGYNLSGGERQRIAIARAILNNPRLLILDEATSALDTESEFLIQQALDRLVKGRTTFAIAHRLSTLRNADRLVVIDRHGIAEIGTHNELLEKKGIYYGLVTAQLKMAEGK